MELNSKSSLKLTRNRKTESGIEIEETKRGELSSS